MNKNEAKLSLQAMIPALQTLITAKNSIIALNETADILNAIDPNQKDSAITYIIYSIENAYDISTESKIKSSGTLLEELDDAIKALEAKITLAKIRLEA